MKSDKKNNMCSMQVSMFSEISHKHTWITCIYVINLLLIDPCLFQVLVPDDCPGESAHEQEVKLTAGINHVSWTQHRLWNQPLLSNLIIPSTSYQIKINLTQCHGQVDRIRS